MASFASLISVCAGCWQEVHYNAGPAKKVSSAKSDTAEERIEAAELEPQVDPTAASESEPATADVTADELFGASAERPRPTLVPQTDEDSPIAAAVPERTDEIPVGDISDAGQVQPSNAPETDRAEPERQAGAGVGHATADVMRPSRTALAVWRMSSRWSFAAAIYAKGQPEDRYRETLDQAAFAAELIGVQLPPFPMSEGMSLEAAVIRYLLDAGSAGFVNDLSEDYVPEYEALAELAIRTNALLLVYTPRSKQLDPLINFIRQSAERSGLPPELWSEFVSMLERREPFDAVKHRVLSFHTEVADYLAGDA